MNRMRAADLVGETLSEGVLTLTLGAPPAHPLSLEMIRALHGALGRAALDAQVRVIVIHGPGRIFCAGHDLKEIARHRADADRGRAFLERLFAACAQMMQAVTNAPQPTIAMVEGLATAAGLQLVAACDLAFAAPGAEFCLPGVNNGGFCTTPAVAVSRNLSRKHVMEMALSGERFDAEWARGAGLVNRIIPAERLAAEVTAFARRLASRHAPALALGKKTLHRQLEMPLEQAYAVATEAMIAHFMDPHRIAEELAGWSSVPPAGGISPEPGEAPS